MNVLKLFNNEHASPEESEGFEKILSVRAVVTDADGNVALIHSHYPDFYTIPGGKIDPGETFEQAIVRECKEEVGCDVEIIAELGKIVEVRRAHRKVGEIMGYNARVVGEKGIPELTDEEIREGHAIEWVTPERAKDLIHADMLAHAEAHQHIGKRALAFLEAAFPST